MTLVFLVLAAGTLYSASLLASLGRSTERRARLTFALGAAGFACQSAWLALRMYATQSLPVSTPYDMLETIVWFLVLFPVMGYAVFRVKIAGIFSMLPAAFMTLLPFGCPLFLNSLSNAPARSAATFAATHALLAAVSYAFMILSASFAAMYFRQKKSLLERRGDSSARFLPSLSALERGMGACIASAAVAMAVSVAAGIMAALSVSQTDALELKFSLGLGVFVMQIIACILVAIGRVKGTRLALTAITLTAVAVVFLFPIAAVSWLR